MPTTRDRPLSPHLSVYRPKYTMVLSFMHRASGVYLSGCAFLYVAWLAAAAIGPDAYACVAGLLATLPMRIVLAAGLAAFWYHLFAGLRHLAWDAGFGFERRTARRSGYTIAFLAAAAFAATLLLSPAGRFVAGLP
jgi:succinate dehydrogenase / fumarate reductase cytochrome b subunit